VKVYVAGRTTDLDRVREVMNALREEGHEITFDWTGPDGEIRTDLDPDDLVVENYIPSGVGPQTLGFEDKAGCRLTHVPTATMTVGTGRSLLQAHQAALQELRTQLKSGWRADPLRARALAQRELDAVVAADAVVLCWSEGILGAAIETGMALALEKPLIVYGAMRDSVFWYLPRVAQADTVGAVLMGLSVLP
jgi:hypothetical protein